jgi:PAS domain S-box-containing protein
MNNAYKTKKQLINELVELRQRIAELEKLETERKQAEARESEKKYRDILDSSLIGIYSTNFKGDIFYVNKALLGMLEFDSLEEMMSINTLTTYKNPNGRESLMKALKETGSISNFEIELLTKTGKSKNVIINAILEGEVISGMIMDITYRKQAEASIKNLRHQNELILNSAGEGIIGLNLKGKHIFVNPSAAKMLGYEVDELIGRQCHTTWHHSKADGSPYPEEECPICETAKSGIIHYLNKEVFWRKDGSSFSVEYSSNPIFENDKLTGTVVTFRDITVRKRMEEALRESEGKYRALIDKASDAIFLADTEGKLLEANKKAEELTGYTREELLKMHFTQIHPEEEHERVLAAFEEGLPKGFGSLNEVIVLRKDDKRVLIDATGSLVEYDGKKVVQAILRDITERKRTEERLRQYTERLKALSYRLLDVQEAERRYIARELHDEIGQVLTGLKFTLDTIHNLPAEDIRAGLSKAQTLVSGLMDRVHNMSLDLRPSMLDDLGLLPALVWHFERYTAQTNVRVKFKHAGIEVRFKPEVETVAYRIVQEALTNVARHACVNEVTVLLMVQQDTLVIRIEDRGIGFDPDTVLSSKITTGLSGMRERLTLLGGQLTIDSSPGNGTRLIAEIPLGDSV